MIESASGTTYKLARAMQALIWIAVLVPLVGGLFWLHALVLGDFVKNHSKAGLGLSYGLAVVLTSLGALGVVALLRTRLTLYDDRFVYHNGLWERTVRLSEIGSVGTVQGQILFYCADHKRILLRLSNAYVFDERFRRFQASLPDKFFLMYQRREHEALADPQLGATETQRRRTLKKHDRRGKYLVAVAAGFGLWGFIYPRPYEALVTVLVLMPVVSAALMFAVPDRVTEKYLGGFFVLPALLIRSTDINLVDQWEPFRPIGVWLFVMIVLLLPKKNGLMMGFGEHRWFGGFSLLMLGAMYSAGAVFVLNRLLDWKSPVGHAVTVEAKRTRPDSDHHMRHYLDLTAWGPHPGRNEVQVGEAWYKVVDTGDTLCVNVHPGALGVAYWQLSWHCQVRSGALTR